MGGSAGQWWCTHSWGMWAHQPQGAGSWLNRAVGGPHLGLARGRDCRQVLCLGARGLSVQNGARRLRCFLQRSENKCNANAGEWEAAGSRVSQTGVRSQAEAGPIWSLQSGSREDSRDHTGDPREAGEGGKHGGQPELPSSGRVCSQGMPGHLIVQGWETKSGKGAEETPQALVLWVVTYTP